MKTYDIHLDECLLCNRELELVELKDMPEWKYICPTGHFKQIVAFWGYYFTINDQEFSVPSLHNEKQVNEINDYLLSIIGSTLITK